MLFTYTFFEKPISNDDLRLKMKEYYGGWIGSKEHGVFDKESGIFTAKTAGDYQFHITWESVYHTGYIDLEVN